MKVCTDACVFGAYVARHVNFRQQVPENILDIGTGTGLLSLMIAQKTNAVIDGIEIEEAAFTQAKHNFEQSRWNKQLRIFNENALEYDPGKKYDCFISNPPFFENDLKSPNKDKNAAKHDSSLSLEQLLSTITRNLSSDGYFAVLLPYRRIEFFIETAKAANYFLNQQLLMQTNKSQPFIRGILFFSHHQTRININELVFKDSSENCTPEFIDLLKDYYLYL